MPWGSALTARGEERERSETNMTADRLPELLRGLGVEPFLDDAATLQRLADVAWHLARRATHLELPAAHRPADPMRRPLERDASRRVVGLAQHFPRPLPHPGALHLQIHTTRMMI